MLQFWQIAFPDEEETSPIPSKQEMHFLLQRLHPAPKS
jgi:hypothetical protein